MGKNVFSTNSLTRHVPALLYTVMLMPLAAKEFLQQYLDADWESMLRRELTTKTTQILTVGRMQVLPKTIV